MPCYACAKGEWDACRNGLYTEHGIKELDGFMRERYRSTADALMRVERGLAERGVLMEPTTIVADVQTRITIVVDNPSGVELGDLLHALGPMLIVVGIAHGLLQTLASTVVNAQ